MHWIIEREQMKITLRTFKRLDGSMKVHQADTFICSAHQKALRRFIPINLPF